MKKLFYFCSVMLAAAAGLSGCGKEAVQLDVISYNIRLGVADDGENSWEYRRPATIAMLQDKMPDIFGVQEAYDFQIAYIEDNLPVYSSVGVGRDDGKEAGEHMSIFYNTETVKLVKWGTFWLSETPEVPSMGWDAACFRSATWALMEKDGHKFYYVNTHLDHVGKLAQKNGLAVIVDRIDDINPEGWPMVLTGDFNVTPNDAVLDDLETRMLSARDNASVTDHEDTYNGWGKSGSVIDYIWYSGFSSCDSFETVRTQYAEIPYISDHYPVMATLTF